MSIETTKAQIAALETQLEAECKAEREAKEAELKAFAQQWRFTMTPCKPESWHRMFDDTIKRYRLRGEMLNRAEYKALGGSGDDGEIEYLWNSVTTKIICADGGGNIYVNERAANSQDIFDRLGAAIAANPDSADVTDIILSNPEFAW